MAGLIWSIFVLTSIYLHQRLIGPLPLQVFQAHSPGRKTLWQTQSLLEGLYIPFGLGTPKDLPGEAGDCH